MANKSTAQDVVKLLRKQGKVTTAVTMASGTGWNGSVTRFSYDAVYNAVMNGAGLPGCDISNPVVKHWLKRELLPLLASQITNLGPPETDDINTDFLELEYVALKKKIKIPGSLVVFSDKYTPSWNKENVYGRMDPIATFQGTGRSFDLTWQINIAGRNKTSLLKAVSDVAKFMYPMYDTLQANQTGTGTMRAPPLLRFTLISGVDGTNLSLIRNTLDPQQGLLGIVDSFSYGSFVAGKGGGGEINMGRTLVGNEIIAAPTHTDLNFSVTVLHQDGKVGWTWSADGTSIHFGQGKGFPYGYGTTVSGLTLAAWQTRPLDPAAGTVLADARAQDDAAADASAEAVAGLTSEEFSRVESEGMIIEADDDT
tara:strand:- start:553 stop:1656 length:1104 start_codon:yes stop_codon:yes gene_type:complete